MPQKLPSAYSKAWTLWKTAGTYTTQKTRQRRQGNSVIPTLWTLTEESQRRRDLWSAMGVKGRTSKEIALRKKESSINKDVLTNFDPRYNNSRTRSRLHVNHLLSLCLRVFKGPSWHRDSPRPQGRVAEEFYGLW